MAERRVRLALEALAQGAHEAGLADAGLAGQQDDLPSPSLARSQRSSSSASSCSRPTSGVSPAACIASKRPSAVPSPRTW
jgi:hypothetical protein